MKCEIDLLFLVSIMFILLILSSSFSLVIAQDEQD